MGGHALARVLEATEERDEAQQDRTGHHEPNGPFQPPPTVLST